MEKFVKPLIEVIYLDDNIICTSTHSGSGGTTEDPDIWEDDD